MAGMEGKRKEQPDLAALVMARFEQSMLQAARNRRMETDPYELIHLFIGSLIQ